MSDEKKIPETPLSPTDPIAEGIVVPDVVDEVEEEKE